MRTFEFYNPTRIIFGKDVCENVGEELKNMLLPFCWCMDGKAPKLTGFING